MKPVIFKYLNFRTFLRDAVAELKRTSGDFSYVSFAKNAGYTSPNLLQLIIQGKRRLPAANILPTSRHLKLKKQETEYFELLVNFNQAKTFQDQEYYFTKLLKHPKYQAHALINKNQYGYFEKWYYPIVRELVTAADYPGDPLWIAKRIYPRITAVEVERAIALLENLNLIYRDGSDGRWKSVDTVVRTPREVTNLVGSLYHKNLLKLAGNAIHAFEPGERDMRAVTLRLSENNYKRLKKKFIQYWDEVLAVAAQDDNSDRVYQVHFSLFPLIKKGKTRK